jgi:CBS domain-containing protein
MAKSTVGSNQPQVALIDANQGNRAGDGEPLRHHKGAAPMNASDVMVSNVITVGPEATVEEIAETLLAKRISAVPVVDERGALIGIVSEGDLIHRVETGTERHRSWWLELLTGRDVLAREYIKSHARKAVDVMTHPAISVAPDMPLDELAALLEKRRIKRVPVVRDGKVVGIVSRANLVQALVTFGKKRNATEASVDDAGLRDDLLAQLQSQPWWSNNVNIIVHDGNVDLWGIVESEAERDAVRVAVEVTPGVHKISNYLGIETKPATQ